jgi:hypothetical protein
MDHQNKTRILRDGFSAGNFASNHPFQIQCTSGGARAIQMGFDPVTESSYIQSMDFLNNLKPLLIRSSALTLSSALPTNSGGTGISTNGAAGQVLTTVTPGVLAWLAVPAITNNFTAITVDSGATFAGGADTTFPNTDGVKIGKTFILESQTKVKIVGPSANLEFRETAQGTKFNATLSVISGLPIMNMFVINDALNRFPISATSPIHIVTSGSIASRNPDDIGHQLVLRTQLTGAASALMAGFDFNNATGYITCGDINGPLPLQLQSAGGLTVIPSGGLNVIRPGDQTANENSSVHTMVLKQTSSNTSVNMQFGCDGLLNAGYINVTGVGATQPLFLNQRNDGKCVMAKIEADIIKSQNLGSSGFWRAGILGNTQSGVNYYDCTWELIGRLCHMFISGAPNQAAPLNQTRNYQVQLPFPGDAGGVSTLGAGYNYTFVKTGGIGISFTNYKNPIEPRIFPAQDTFLQFIDLDNATVRLDDDFTIHTRQMSISIIYRISSTINLKTLTGPTVTPLVPQS